MKRSRFTDEQIGRILQEADKDPVAEVSNRRGGSSTNLRLSLAWKERFPIRGTRMWANRPNTDPTPTQQKSPKA
jgi:putative transposase